MKLIIVDDSHSKVELLRQAISIAGVEVDITHETNAAGARKRLRNEQFDLLLIDLQLPDVAGSVPNQTGGLDFFDLLVVDPKAALPAEILFVTSEDSLVSTGRSAVEHRGSALCVVSTTNESWKQVLVGQIKLADRRACRKTVTADAVVITALSSELDAVLALEFGWGQYRLDGDPTIYYKGTFIIDNQERTVIAASALRKGMAASAALATKMVLKFQPKIIAMTGICAGVKDKVGLGDVIVGNPTWDWGSGKHAEDDKGSAIFKLSPKQSDLNLQILNLCHEISRSQNFKRSVRANWVKAFPPFEFACHIGPMASGASVVASSSVAEDILKQNRDLIAIEMEAFAVMVAGEYATSVPLHSVAIKSVCDFADKEKQDDWQPFAAYTSAQFTAELFKMYFKVNGS